MNKQSTWLLLTLFFGGLLTLWWAESSRIPDQQQRRRLSGRVLPQLIDTDPRSVRRVEITGGSERLVFEREANMRWRMVEPVRASAASGQLETLLTNLKLLHRLKDADTLSGPPATFGLDHPVRTVRLFGAGGESAQPLAALEIGAVAQDRRYVRAVGEPGIEICEALPLAPLELNRDDWRERTMFWIAPFDIDGLDVSAPDGAGLRVRREGGRWRLVTPIQAPADLNKIDAVLTELTGMRVSREPSGFVASGVRDFAPYGLDRPSWTITLTSARGQDSPQTLQIGKEVPDAPGLVYARRGDQDEVLAISARAVVGLGTQPSSLRSLRLTDLDLARAARIELLIEGVRHELKKTSAAGSWEIVQPEAAPADSQVVKDLLAQIANLQATEFRDASRVPNPGLDEPAITLRVWEEADRSGPNREPVPVLDLALGRIELARKTVWGRVAGDPRLAALPDSFLEELPSGPLAFRERSIVKLGQGWVDRIEQTRAGLRVVVEAAGAPDDFARWRMTAPVQAPIDLDHVARLAVLLADLRADRLVAAEPDDLAPFGLDTPELALTFTSRRKSTSGSAVAPRAPDPAVQLLVGAREEAGSEARFAKLRDSKLVFTLSKREVATLEAELHDRRVFSFAADRAVQVEVIHWDQRLIWQRQPGPPGTAWRWVPVKDNSSRITSEQVEALVNLLAQVPALRYLQYNGPFPESAGLAEPRATIRLSLEGESEPRLLRLGAPGTAGTRQATTSPRAEGPLLLVPDVPFLPWLGIPTTLPDNPFAPDTP